ncbi:hypothetical protein VNI00_002971 [Paramarasmius palmivorus]|uniref:Peptidase M20 dimerisation domain-containing protein n=1 Tax=Paramarasmius palmivorus TaxID=297713 RepID=A0AAW0DVJ1_9AGAR
MSPPLYTDSTPGCFTGLFKRRKQSRHPVSTRGPAQSSSRSSEKVSTAKEQSDERFDCYCPNCDFSFGKQALWWPCESQATLPAYTPSKDQFRSVSTQAIDTVLDDLKPKLRKLSLQIHENPELQFEEKFAHDLLTSFMEDHGFKVTRRYLGLSTAWRAEYTHGSGGRVVGINSEMDALNGIGHACGHNLIATSGCGVAIALKTALQATGTSGKIILLGTPAEESGGGKIILLERGGYKDMDICIMSHPGPGPSHSFDVGSSNAMQTIEVEYFGKNAHAGMAPWEGTNALDAAFLAYSSISVLRQQIKPDHRVHGVILGKDWLPNVIPDYAKMRWIVRAPSHLELEAFADRVVNCFKAASMATGCKVNIKADASYYDLNQNEVLAKEFTKIAKEHFQMDTTCQGSTASTDFGNVGYHLPALHPMFAIPTEPNGGNHTAAFARSAATDAAHDATMCVTQTLAMIAFRTLHDDEFFKQVSLPFLITVSSAGHSY